MARPILQLLPLFLYVLYIAGTTESTVQNNFVQDSCRTTRYPALCVRSLSSHAAIIRQSPHQLAQTALMVSLATAQSTKTNMEKLANQQGIKAKESGVLKDCLDQIQDGMDQLSRSIKEIEQMGNFQGEKLLFHISNVQTWTSAALSGFDTCVEEFSSQALDEEIKASIKGQITNTEQLMSNALALVNQFATTH